MFENEDLNSDMEPFSLSPYRNKVDVSGPDPIAWFRTGQLVAAATGVSKLLTWCSRCLGKSLSVAREKVFPHHWYQQELQKMFERLDGLERELQQLRDSRPESPAEKDAVVPPGTCSGCRCSQCGKPVSVFSMATTDCVQQARVPPPPPPPPPPPVLTPTATYIRTRKRRISSKEENNSRPSVTLQQLQQVKLRRAEPRPPLRAENGTTPELDLRQRVLKTAIGQGKENIQDRIASEVLGFKGSLKKTSVKRSPGGTPIMKRRRPTGKGLTPMMATALKKKFVFANDSHSSSDDSLEGSPSPQRQISPLARHDSSVSPSPCKRSPLADTTN